jgi:hypothetical protein
LIVCNRHSQRCGCAAQILIVAGLGETAVTVIEDAPLNGIVPAQTCVHIGDGDAGRDRGDTGASIRINIAGERIAG